MRKGKFPQATFYRGHFAPTCRCFVIPSLPPTPLEFVSLLSLVKNLQISPPSRWKLEQLVKHESSSLLSPILFRHVRGNSSKRFSFENTSRRVVVKYLFLSWLPIAQKETWDRKRILSLSLSNPSMPNTILDKVMAIARGKKGKRVGEVSSFVRISRDQYALCPPPPPALPSNRISPVCRL